MSIEQTILGNLVHDETYSRSVIAFLKKEYFHDQAEKITFSLISHYTQKYNALPSKEVLLIDLDKVKGLSEDTYSKIVDLVRDLKKTEADKDWLLSETESFCKNKAVYNAIMESISRYENKDKGTIDSIPQLLTDAVSVSFDQYIGHDYLEQAEERWEYYQRKDTKIPFEVDMLNKITEGGVSLKTLTVILAGIHVGKSLIMGAMAAHNLICGHNVLYVSLELAEEVVSQRIDANLMGVNMSDIKTLSKEDFKAKADKIRKKTQGKLIVKEYATASINVNHIRHLLNELKLKKNFVPHVIYIDYLNLLLSSRVKGENSYTTIKSIAEELRGLAVDMNVPIISATQLTRSGISSADVGMEDTAESIGLPATCDLFLAVTQTEELKEMGRYLIKQLKNRMGDISKFTRFVIGVDKPKMRLYDVEDQGNIHHEVEIKVTSEEKPALKEKFINWE